MKIQYIGKLHSITLEDRWIFSQNEVLDIPDAIAQHLIARSDFQIIQKKESKKKRGEK